MLSCLHTFQVCNHNSIWEVDHTTHVYMPATSLPCLHEITVPHLPVTPLQCNRWGPVLGSILHSGGLCSSSLSHPTPVQPMRPGIGVHPAQWGTLITSRAAWYFILARKSRNIVSRLGQNASILHSGWLCILSMPACLFFRGMWFKARPCYFTAETLLAD